MATQVNDGTTRPVVNTDASVDPEAHRVEEVAVGKRDDGEMGIIALTNANEVKTSGGGGGGGAVTIADGADVTQGAIADAGVTGDSAGTVSAKLRGLLTILTDVWDVPSSSLVVSDGGSTLSVDDGGGALSTDSADGAHATLGATTDAEAPTGDGSVIALLKSLRTLLNPGGAPGGNKATFAIIAAGSHVGTQISSDLVNENNRALIIFLKVTAIGGGNLVLVVQALDTLTGTNQILNVADPEIFIRGVGTFTYIIGVNGPVPTTSGADKSGLKQAIPMPMATDYRVTVTHTTPASTWSYSVSGQLYGGN